MHKVGIEELQKFNHIENDRKLQIGQTLIISRRACYRPLSLSERAPCLTDNGIGPRTSFG